MVEFIDETSEKTGTDINRKNMMAIQGFSNKKIFFDDLGRIIEENEDGEQLITEIDGNKIVETFYGEKIISKTTEISDGIITEKITEVNQ